MNGSDKWFRWTFNIFIFLMCFQFSMLLFLKSLFYKAERRLKDNTAVVTFSCKDFNGEKAYWEIPESESKLQGPCLDTYCPDSFWTQTRSEQPIDLNILAVQKAQPSLRKEGQVEIGHFVNVKVAESSKPQVLALVSQSLMQWTLEVHPESQLQEVMIVGPELVWIEGLPENVRLTYFSPEQICAYPVAWEEQKNSENQFRRLIMALKSYSGLELTSFQGKEVGRRFQVPFKSPLLEIERRLASTEVPIVAGPGKKRDIFSLGIQWQRDQRRLQAQSFQFLSNGNRKRVLVPQKTRSALFHAQEEKVFIISNHQFGVWDWETEKFEVLRQPLDMAVMHWPALMAQDPTTGEVYIYNEDRGGELFTYQPKTGSWAKLEQQVGYSLVALDFEKRNKNLIGTRVQNQKISKFVKINATSGQVLQEVSLEKSFEFLKSLWRADIISDHTEYWLKLSHPAHPGGDIYPLSQVVSQLSD